MGALRKSRSVISLRQLFFAGLTGLMIGAPVPPWWPAALSGISIAYAAVAASPRAVTPRGTASSNVRCSAYSMLRRNSSPRLE